jgi:hypothetical protein
MDQPILKKIDGRKFMLNFLFSIITGLIVIHFVNTKVEWLSDRFFTILSIIFILIAFMRCWMSSVIEKSGV